MKLNKQIFILGLIIAFLLGATLTTIILTGPSLNYNQSEASKVVIPKTKPSIGSGEAPQYTDDDDDCVTYSLWEAWMDDCAWYYWNW